MAGEAEQTDVLRCSVATEILDHLDSDPTFHAEKRARTDDDDDCVIVDNPPATDNNASPKKARKDKPLIDVVTLISLPYDEGFTTFGVFDIKLLTETEDEFDISDDKGNDSTKTMTLWDALCHDREKDGRIESYGFRMDVRLSERLWKYRPSAHKDCIREYIEKEEADIETNEADEDAEHEDEEELRIFRREAKWLKCALTAGKDDKVEIDIDYAANGWNNVRTIARITEENDDNE